jgi:hypothetical protein
MKEIDLASDRMILATAPMAKLSLGTGEAIPLEQVILDFKPPQVRDGRIVRMVHIAACVEVCRLPGRVVALVPEVISVDGK